MDHRKNKPADSRETSKKGPPLGLVIALAAAGGVVIGSAGTYFLTKPFAPPKESASPAAPTAGQTPQAQPLTVPNPPPQNQLTPAPQPPGPVPPGKVWSAEHGHWHDAPGALPNLVPAPTAPGTTPTPATPATPAATIPIPAVPVEKKQ